VHASGSRAAYISAAEQLWETFIAWYDAHPDATFDEMEEVAGEQGRGLLGDVLALAVRRGDLGRRLKHRVASSVGGRWSSRATQRRTCMG